MAIKMALSQILYPQRRCDTCLLHCASLHIYTLLSLKRNVSNLKSLNCSLAPMCNLWWFASEHGTWRNVKIDTIYLEVEVNIYGSLEMGFTEMGFPEMSIPEIGFPEMGVPEMGFLDMGIPGNAPPRNGCPGNGRTGNVFYRYGRPGNGFHINNSYK